MLLCMTGNCVTLHSCLFAVGAMAGTNTFAVVVVVVGAKTAVVSHQ